MSEHTIVRGRGYGCDQSIALLPCSRSLVVPDGPVDRSSDRRVADDQLRRSAGNGTCRWWLLDVSILELGHPMHIEGSVVDGGFDPRSPLLERSGCSFQRRDSVVSFVVDLGEADQLEVIDAPLHRADAMLQIVALVVGRHRSLGHGDAVALQRRDPVQIVDVAVVEARSRSTGSAALPPLTTSSAEIRRFTSASQSWRELLTSSSLFSHLDSIAS